MGCEEIVQIFISNQRFGETESYEVTIIINIFCGGTTASDQAAQQWCILGGGNDRLLELDAPFLSKLPFIIQHFIDLSLHT